MIDMAAIVHRSRGFNIGVSESRVILSCRAAPQVIPLVKVLQLHREDSALDTVHAHVKPGEDMLVPLRGPMIAPQPNSICKFSVIRSHCSTLAAGAEILARIETKATRRTECTCFAALILCAVRL